VAYAARMSVVTHEMCRNRGPTTLTYAERASVSGAGPATPTSGAARAPRPAAPGGHADQRRHTMTTVIATSTASRDAQVAAAAGYRVCQPPSTMRSTPLTAVFSSRNDAAPTISDMVARRPIGVSDV
jgi:hypothetical protein